MQLCWGLGVSESQLGDTETGFETGKLAGALLAAAEDAHEAGGASGRAALVGEFRYSSAIS